MPHPIYFTAATTTGLAAVIGYQLWKQQPARPARDFLLLAALMTLPMNPIAYWAIRLPFLDPLWLWITAHVYPHIPPALLKSTKLWGVLKLCEAPLAEDLAKLWPLLLFFFRRELRNENQHFAKVAIALGIGFGVGEAWTVAHLVAQNPRLPVLPWWQYQGFIVERLMVCLMHGAFTATALRRFGKGFHWGILSAMGLHFLGNAPIMLAAWNLPPFGKAVWQQLLGLWVLGYFFAMAALLAYYLYGTFEVGRLLYGHTRCPRCNELYARPFFRFNFPTRAYERCANCHSWNWIPHNSAEPPKEP